MNKKKSIKIAVAAVAVSAVAVLGAGAIIGATGWTGSDYTIPEVDLSAVRENVDTQSRYLYEQTVVDDTEDYLGHPDSVLLKDGKILTLYPKGHGKGAILNKLSADGGKSWSDSVKDTPLTWEDSLETPTVYRCTLHDGSEKLILISANPQWPNMKTDGGFNCSVSSDEGQTWTQFESFYSKGSNGGVVPIVAMSSLTQLKENGEFVDKWMGTFHDSEFINYKTILTFDEDGYPYWSKPEKYFSKYRLIEEKAKMCEVEIIRSDGGKGDELCLIARSNSKKMNSLISFSTDEGASWSQPKEVPAALNGERHKAEWTNDGRLFITFRSIERGPKAKEAKGFHLFNTKKWISEGWVAWVGTYDDLKNGKEGQYRIKLAHTYLDGQSADGYVANPDTGYCGNVVLPDGTIVTSSYGQFSPKAKASDGKLKTYIISKRINLKDTDKLVNK